jgi:Dolichyl-phosphate-mannose-protein mannosyltransferase
MSFQKPGLLVFAVTFGVFAFSVNGGIVTDHSTSLVQLTYALWHNHSAALDSASTSGVIHSVDDFAYNGLNYSAVPPGTAVLAMPFLGLAFTLYGAFTVNTLFQALFLSGLFVALMAALGCYLVYRISRLYFRTATSVFLAFAFGFSTICWPFATLYFQNDVSATFVLLTAYFALVAGSRQGSAFGYSLATGLAAGGSVTVDYVNGAILVPVLLFLVLARWRRGLPRLKSSLACVLGMGAGLGLLGAYNYSIFGTPFRFSEIVSNNFKSPGILGGFTNPFWNGLALYFVSPLRGVFLYSPILVLGAAGFYLALRSRKTRVDYMLLLALFLSITLPYASWFDPRGGLSYGPRYMLAAIPFLLVPAGVVIEDGGMRRRALAAALYLLGVFVCGSGALVTAISDAGGDRLPSQSPFLETALPKLAAGRLDTWWLGGVGHYWVVPVVLLFAVAGAIPLALFLVTEREGGTGGARESLPSSAPSAQREDGTPRHQGSPSHLAAVEVPSES